MGVISRIKRDVYSISYFSSFHSIHRLCPFQLPVSAGGVMRAQNFNYLRKISTDPWREIERSATKCE